MKIKDQDRLMTAVRDFLNAEDHRVAVYAEPFPKRGKKRIAEQCAKQMAACDKTTVALGELRRVYSEVNTARYV